MKKRIGAGIVLIGLLLALVFSPAGAQDEGPTETFDSETLEGWELSEGAVVRDGVLRISPGNFAVKFGQNHIGTLGVKVKHAGSGAVFIRYAMGPGGSYALILLDDVIILEKDQSGGPAELGVYEWTGAAGVWVEVRIVVSDGQHEIFLDEESIIKATDPSPLQGGEFGFMVEGEGAAEFAHLTLVLAAGAPAGEAGPPAVDGPAPDENGASAAATPTAAATEGPLSVSDLIAELTSSQASPTELSTFVINLLMAVVLSYILTLVYIHWGSSLSNRRRFAANFVLITVTTTFIILVVRSSVALSLGLVGALSIVRFRAAIKEPEELAYLFFAIAIGIGLGDNQRLITVLAVVVAILVLAVMRLFRGRGSDFNLHITVASQNPEKIDLEAIMAALSPHCAQIKLMRFDDSGAALESAFLVEFRTMEKLKAARSALRGLSQSLEITFLDNKGIW